MFTDLMTFGALSLPFRALLVDMSCKLTSLQFPTAGIGARHCVVWTDFQMILEVLQFSFPLASVSLVVTVDLELTNLLVRSSVFHSAACKWLLAGWTVKASFQMLIQTRLAEDSPTLVVAVLEGISDSK